VFHQIVEFKIALRIDIVHGRVSAPSNFRKFFAVRGCTGNTTGNPPVPSAMAFNSRSNCCSPSTFAGRCSVTTKYRPGSSAQRTPEGRRTQTRHLLQQRIDHGVADEEDPVIRDPGPAQVLVGGVAGGEEPIGDGIRHHAVDLLRHGPVVRADAAFHMRHRHAHLRATIEQAMVEVTSPTTRHRSLFSPQHPFVAHHDRRGLLGLRPRPHLQIDVRIRYAELFEKASRHGSIVVLSRMDEAEAQLAAVRASGIQGVDDRRDFHEIRPGAGDEIDTFHSYGIPSAFATRPSSSIGL
jgi:hypothetical protein